MNPLASPDDPDRHLHQRLLAGDPTAFAALAERHIEALVNHLSRLRRVYDPHLVEEAVGEALLNYARHPDRFDPGRRSLYAYLLMSAHGDLLNALKREKLPDSLVELDALTTEYPLEDERASTEGRVLVSRLALEMQLAEILENPVDLQIVELMMDGIRETSEYARVLGIGDQSPEEQATQVKRHKDRIKASLKRQLDPNKLQGE